MGRFFKTAGEKAVEEVLNGLPLRNKVDSIRLMAEDLRRGYDGVIGARGKLRDCRDALEILQATSGTPAADITTAENAVKDAERRLHESENTLRALERHAQSKFPDYFKIPYSS